jgi:hypothetical protein
MLYNLRCSALRRVAAAGQEIVRGKNPMPVYYFDDISG